MLTTSVVGSVNFSFGQADCVKATYHEGQFALGQADIVIKKNFTYVWVFQEIM